MPYNNYPMKPIIKPQKKQSNFYVSKQILLKIAKNTTLTSDQPKDTQGCTKLNQKFSKNRTINTKVESTISQNSILQGLTKEQSQWNQQSQFRRHNTEWNNFILIYNPKFTGNTLYCGKCHKSFGKVIQFIFHCLSDCKEICHNESSHFILQICEWRNLIAKNQTKSQSAEQTISKQYPQQTAIKELSQQFIKDEQQLNYQNIKEPQTKLSKAISLGHPRKQGNLTKENDEQKRKRINQFSRHIISQWRDQNIQQIFIIDKDYILFFNFVIVINPFFKRSQSESIKVCNTCKIKFSNNKLWFITHYYERCSKLDNENNQLLILNSQLFYAYLLGQKKNDLAIYNLDLGFLNYLYKKTPQREIIEKMYPRFKYYSQFISIYYACFEGYDQINYDNQVLRSKRELKSENRSWAIFTICLANLKYFRSFNIFFYQKYLKDQFLYCPTCREMQMSYVEFISHLGTKHKEGSFKVRLSRCLQ